MSAFHRPIAGTLQRTQTDRAPAPGPTLMLDATVPRLAGIPGALVRTMLGVADLATIFEQARVGDVRDESGHSTFRIALEDGCEVGGTTKLGVIAVGNAGGNIRVSVPWSWRSALNLAQVPYSQGQDETGKVVAVGLVEPTVGAKVEIPLPVGRGWRIAVAVVGRG